MAKFFDAVGFAMGQVEKDPGVYVDDVVERKYFGDVVRNTAHSREGEQLNNDRSVGNSISIISDAFANENFTAISFVKWAGTLWTVTTVEVQRPRLLLSLGEVYHGERASS